MHEQAVPLAVVQSVPQGLLQHQPWRPTDGPQEWRDRARHERNVRGVPQPHLTSQPTDVFTTYSDADFRLGLNAAQTTLSAVAQLTGATIRK